MENSTTHHEIVEKVDRARTAMESIVGYDQDQALDLVRAVARLAIDNAERWGRIVLDETGMGNVESKTNRTRTRARGLLRDYLSARTVGVIEEDTALNLLKIGKPVGVVASVVPTTVPEGVVFMGAMNALLGRNAMICSPHPRAKVSTARVVEDIRELLSSRGLPADLLQVITEPSLEHTNHLMAQSDLVVATGGAGMVRAAYSSGTPAYGVGAGNSVAVVDRGADLHHVASELRDSQMSDYAIGCSTENAVVLLDEEYDAGLQAMKETEAHVCTSDEKRRLQDALFAGGHLNADLICRSAETIAEAAGIAVPAGTNWLVVEEDGVGAEHPFSGEKLSVVVAAYRSNSFEDSIELVNRIHAYSGAGHSCGVYSDSREHVLEFAERTFTTRVAVNQATTKSNAGGWTTGMPFTINLGCGTWGGNVLSANVTWREYINTTWVASPVEPVIPDDDVLFGHVA
ncbi:aldehyde dehydrogenase family protein [Brachybacterium sacelli]|uniref:Sulfoacetaldehyde dehydrogenase n=1 Tax=Brachybacterium sacelli TaxID=173364 RepID=A0ABS4WZ91_9MICO|nr:aldehyde dehydrogenase family protein [Brachybacterium sacelli]MBP2381529.1 sulfoacetaldehyde dehydrogenase [Brachybacterium sacelli]